MRHYTLTKDQKAATGFTDMVVITAAHDLATQTVADNTDLDIVLIPLLAGDVVDPKIVAEIITVFSTDGAVAQPSSNYSMGLSLGVASAETTFIDDSSSANTLVNAGTQAAAGTTIVPAGTVAAYKATTGINIEARLEVSDADGGVDELLYGELRIWFNISRRADRALASPAW